MESLGVVKFLCMMHNITLKMVVGSLLLWNFLQLHYNVIMQMKVFIQLQVNRILVCADLLISNKHGANLSLSLLEVEEGTECLFHYFLKIRMKLL